MSSLATDLKNLIAKRLDAASPSEIIEIVSQLCVADEPVEFSFSAPPALERFTKHDGVIEDATTGLMWADADLPDRADWAAANKAAAALNVGGFSDWRLPTIRELQSLLDFERRSPAADPVLSLKADWYWTSTPAASSPGGCAWCVVFNNGYSYWSSQNYEGLVRAVRPRQ